MTSAACSLWMQHRWEHGCGTWNPNPSAGMIRADFFLVSQREALEPASKTFFHSFILTTAKRRARPLTTQSRSEATMTWSIGSYGRTEASTGCGAKESLNHARNLSAFWD